MGFNFAAAGRRPMVVSLRFLSASLFFCFFLGAGTRAETTNDLDGLVAAYSDVLLRHDGSNIYWKDGTIMPVGNVEPPKSFQQRIINASILDQFYLKYPAGKDIAPPRNDFDPGRFRNAAFFQKLYGDCRAGAVSRNLKTVPWFPKGQSVKITALHGVADQLAKVSAEIAKLPDHIRRAVYPTAGVLSCRPVADTGKMSMHAYGAAIDLNLAYSDYWIWQSKGGKQEIRYRNRMPREIVDIFERNGFIWGGRWYHFDTMHFEYRPELLAPSQ
jgi:hypothetical protein